MHRFRKGLRVVAGLCICSVWLMHLPPTFNVSLLFLPHACPPSAQAGVAQAAASLPWEMTPLLGLLTDSVAVFGYHRKAYLLIIGIIGGAREHGAGKWSAGK